MATKIRKLGIGFFFVSLLVVGLVWRQIARRAPEHATLKTYAADILKAKAAAGESYQIYAYHLHHYSRDAFDNVPWETAVRELERQGFRVQDNFFNLNAELPAADFVLPSGERLNFRLYLNRVELVSDKATTRFESRFPSAGLTAEVNGPLMSQTRGRFPAGSILRAVLDRPKLVAMSERFPTTVSLDLSYSVDRKPTGPSTSPPAEGKFEVQVRVRRLRQGNHESTEFYYQAPTRLEPRKKRLFSWLPLEFWRSLDEFHTFTAVGESDLSSANWTKEFLCLEWKAARERDDKQDSFVYSNLDVLALPRTTEGICVYDPVDIRLLERLPALKHFSSMQHLSDDDMANLAKVRSLESISGSFYSAKNLPAIASLPNLKQFWASFQDETDGALKPLLSSKRITGLAVSSRSGAEVIRGLSRMPALESLAVSVDEDDPRGSRIWNSSIGSLRKIPHLKTLDLTLPDKSTLDLSFLATLGNLEELTITNGTLSDQTVRALATSKKLKSLHLTAISGLTDANIQAFATTPNLKLLFAYRCSGVTRQGFLDLKAKLPSGFTGPD